MQDGGVSDGYAIADDAGPVVVIDMQHGVVLDAGLVANANVIDIAANGDMRPDAGALTDDDVADDDGARVDVAGFANAGRNTTVGSDHFFGGKRLLVNYNLTAKAERVFFLVIVTVAANEISPLRGVVRWLLLPLGGGFAQALGGAACLSSCQKLRQRLRTLAVRKSGDKGKRHRHRKCVKGKILGRLNENCEPTSSHLPSEPGRSAESSGRPARRL
jgi:hypothetical protein